MPAAEEAFLCVDAKGHVSAAGPTIVAWLGLPDASSLIGRPLRELVQVRDASQLEAAMRDGHGVLLAAMRTASNQELEVCMSIEGGPEEGVSVVRLRSLPEVCPLRRSITSLEQEQTDLFQRLPVGIVVHGPAVEILEWNDKALELLGLTAAQLTGRTSFDPRWNVIHPDGSDFPGSTHPSAVAAETKQPVRGVVMGVHRPTIGDRVWLLVDAHPRMESGGKLRDVVVSFTDITAQRKLGEDFREAQKYELVSQMAGSFAHDFNNTLAVIMAVAESLALDASSDAQRDDLQQLVDAATRGALLTRKLLSLSGGSIEQPRRLLVDEHLAEIAQLLTRAAGDGVDLRLRLGAPSAVLVADPSRLEQALLNLTVNATDAMPRGGTIVVGTHTSGAGDDAFVTIDVQDTGPGIPHDVAERIFEPFYTTKGPGKGTGLGLASVKAFASALDGEISFDTCAEGTTFHLVLPCTLESDVGTESEQARPPPGLRPDPSPESRILVVDNDSDVRRALDQLLRRIGYDVMAVSSGETALEVLETNPIDLLITDLVMPEMDGATLGEKARSQDSTLPILFISGFVDPQTAQLPPATDQIQFLAKPFSSAELREAVEMLLTPLRSRADAPRPS